MRVSSDMPDDVIVLHDALEQLQTFKQSPKDSNPQTLKPLTLHLKNCGTALRFLQVHLEKCYPGEPITLTGNPRLMERDGKPTTQTTSARILHGESIPVALDESPYITMSRKIAEAYPNVELEPDWSAAAFWYEYIAIHGGELKLEGLKKDSLQGDKIVAEIYAKYFGVETTFTAEGTILQAKPVLQCNGLTGKAGLYLYEPSAAILKAGAYKLIAERFGLLKLDVNTHLYGSEELVSNFPGRVWRITEKQDLKQANVLCRNYPLTPEALKKKLHLRDGGTAFVIGCRVAGKPTVFYAERV